MKIRTNRREEFKETDRVYLELETSNPKNKVQITIEELFTGNLQITKTSDLSRDTIMISPVVSNQIQIIGD